VLTYCDTAVEGDENPCQMEETQIAAAVCDSFFSYSTKHLTVGLLGFVFFFFLLNTIIRGTDECLRGF